jgi:hypothetical protein
VSYLNENTIITLNIKKMNADFFLNMEFAG